jgi:hypothetical protein
MMAHLGHGGDERTQTTRSKQTMLMIIPEIRQIRPFARMMKGFGAGRKKSPNVEDTLVPFRPRYLHGLQLLLEQRSSILAFRRLRFHSDSRATAAESAMELRKHFAGCVYMPGIATACAKASASAVAVAQYMS